MHHVKNMLIGFFPTDIIDISKNLKILNLFKSSLSGIFTIGSDCHQTVNYISKLSKLHHTNLKISKICKNKNLTRKF